MRGGGGGHKPKNLRNFGLRFRCLFSIRSLLLLRTELATLIDKLVVEVAVKTKKPISPEAIVKPSCLLPAGGLATCAVPGAGPRAARAVEAGRSSSKSPSGQSKGAVTID